jgi:hypothetical protein
MILRMEEGNGEINGLVISKFQKLTIVILFKKNVWELCMPK